MNWLHLFRLRLQGLFSKDRLDCELDEELRTHLSLEIDENLRRGMSVEEARKAAQRKFGNIEQVKEAYRDRRGIPFVEIFWRDLRFAGRTLLRSPGFTAVAVISLALGIGATTAIFTVIDALFLKSLPVNQPGQLAFVWTGDDSTSHFSNSFTYSDFVRFRDLSSTFSGVSAVWEISRSNVLIGGPAGVADPEQVTVGFASGDFFSLLGLNPAVGRLITPDDDRVLGANAVAVISHDYWQRRFALARDIVGRTFSVNGATFTIIGVAPPGFSGEQVGDPTDMWVPFMMQHQVMPEVSSLDRQPTRVIARLKPGSSLSQAQAASQVLYQQLLREQVGANPSTQVLQQISRQRIVLQSAARGYAPLRDTFAQPLAVLMVGVGLLLLIACANVATLLLARAAARRREITVRLALGASRCRIIRQLLAENALLALLAGLLGVAFAVLGTNVLASFAGRLQFPGAVQATLAFLPLDPDARNLALTAALSALTALLFGVLPALWASDVSLARDLSGHGTSTSGAERRIGLGKALVIAQAALSLVLLVGAALFVRTLHNLRSQNLGFDRQHALLLWTLPAQTGRQGGGLMNFWQTVEERLSVVPGVISASAQNGGILSGTLRSPGRAALQMILEGQPPKFTTVPGGRTFIAPRFFETMGIPLVAGREFTDRDSASAARVVIINETMARFFFGNQNAVGQLVRFPWESATASSTEIIGVAKDFARSTPRSVGHDQFSTFFSYRDRDAGPNLWTMCIVVRTVGDPLVAATAVRQELRNIDPALPVVKVETAEQQLDYTLTQERLVAALSSFFGALAVSLACLGLYGVISYSVTRRTNEIGVRLALGAQRVEVWEMVVGESLLLVVAGISIGLPATLVASRMIASQLYGLRPNDALTIAGANVLLLIVCALGAFLPAYRASRVDPMVALRHD